MRRGIASLWHASSLVLAGVLFFLFVLPRWFELTGQWPVALGTVMRIVCGLLVGLTALPVVLTLVRTRKPELGTPTLALSLRVWSIVGHIAAGLLILGAAISEIWLDLDEAGPWLFGIYGAAAAIALLGAFAFYLAFVAELPPPPPKPLKVKAEKPGTSPAAERTESAEADETTESEAAGEDAESAAEEPVDETESAEETASEQGKLRNRRPSGKSRRTRTRGGVATEN
ncbi:hypothetical protein V4U86_01530 [Mycobacterium sp. AMU20-3851]|uniref:hypothetical protein n=1 Tax=Mycobacterium sp. AMU20-3851 TaxID=3122055 RepID=UPI0037544BA1